MVVIAELFDQAVQYHQGGQLAQAESLYRQILQANPSHADALHLLGVVAHQIALYPAVAEYHYNLGNVFKDLAQWTEASNSYRQALAINFNYADAHNNLGNALKSQGQQAEATSCYRQALAINPNHADAKNNVGLAYLMAGQPGEAIACFRQVLAINPNRADTLNSLGVALKNQRQVDEAIDCYRQALRLNPNNADALSNLGEALKEVGQLAEALACCRQALAINPNHADAYNNLGNVQMAEGRPAEAAECYRQTLFLKPNHANAHNNLGNFFFREGQVAEAIQCFQRALAIKADLADAHSNLGVALAHQGHLAEAAECYRQTLNIDGRHRIAQANRGLLRLLQEDFEQGWPDYELRWALPEMALPVFQQPRWDGSRLDGKTILVYAEQGLGDTIQFVRYLPMLKERGGRVVFKCQPLLFDLLSGVAGIDQLVPAGAPLPAFDVQLPLLSLPGLLRTTLATIPALVPYLRAAPRLISSWRKELATGFKIGIAWQGNPKVLDDRLRSIPLKYFERLAEIPGVKLISLQKGQGANQLHGWAGQLPILDLSDRLMTFSDTAAVMMNLDLIVSSCTAVAHLAGALGLPVWLALQRVADWRWFMDRQDSPWYPTMRLFRQKRLGDWGEVFERIGAEISRLL